MAVVCGYTMPGAADTVYLATVKGAPETIRTMVGYGTGICPYGHMLNNVQYTYTFISLPFLSTSHLHKQQLHLVSHM